MFIESLSVENFRSFAALQRFEFQPGFNVLLGANNSGKTSVLDVLDLNEALTEPHRSEISIPTYGGTPIGHSKFTVSMRFRFDELVKLNAGNLRVPIQEPPTPSDAAVDVREALKSNESLSLTTEFGASQCTIGLTGPGAIRGQSKRGQNVDSVLASIRYSSWADPPNVKLSRSGGIMDALSTFQSQLKAKIYRFTALRRPGSNSASSGAKVLDREALMLPYHINDLQTNDAYGHAELCRWVHRVFPNVSWIQAPPMGGNTFELRCLPLTPDKRRDDLATPLERMGAGIGNVIAMLYVVLTSREPQVIAIDEPNAYLHPRALRELLAILETEGRQHQFIVSAHSADVLTGVSARSISLLKFDGVRTKAFQVSDKGLHELRGDLADLGIRMTDLHAKDLVLWSEGQTEELVLPQILRWACPEWAAGTAVLRVEQTGTFSKKKVDPSEVVSIYERLSHSSALVPPLVCILLDGESRTPAERADLTAKSGGRLRFLNRCMIENYLLHPRAIEASLVELEEPIDPSAVNSALSAALGSGPIESLSGARLLDALYANLTAARQEFRKTRDVPVLVEWLLQHEPSFLDPLRDELRAMFTEASARGAQRSLSVA